MPSTTFRLPPAAVVAVRTLALSFLGGLALDALGFPGAWLLGGMILVGAVALFGVRTDVPIALRPLSLFVIGIMIGTAVTPETVASLPRWPVSIACLIAATVLIQVACQLFFQRIAGWSRETAFFASVPGALSFVMAAASTTSADVRLVAIAQTVRLFTLVAVLPLIILVLGLAAAPSAPPVVLTWPEMGIVFVASLAAGGVFHLVRVPVPWMMGPLLASAVLHGGGWVHGSLPPPLLATALVVLGAFVGDRFAGTDPSLLRRVGLASLGGFVVAGAMAATLGLLTALAAHQPVGSVLLAFAPGGLETMTVLALALQLDAAFVATHHLIRMVGIVLAMPFVARWFGSAPPPATMAEEQSDAT